MRRPTALSLIFAASLGVGALAALPRAGSADPPVQYFSVYCERNQRVELWGYALDAQELQVLIGSCRAKRGHVARVEHHFGKPQTPGGQF